MVTVALDQSVGYGIVLGLGFAFALGMVSCSTSEAIESSRSPG